MNPFGQKFDSENVYATSDSHAFHKNYVRGISEWENKERCLDFNTMDEYMVTLVKSFNDTVPADGILFHMGDFSFGYKERIPEFRAAINCKNIHLILGNHDYHIRKDPELQDLFSSVQDYSEIYVKSPSGTKQCILFHYPMKVWNNCHRINYALTGHSHGSLPYEDHELGIDLGWNIWRKPLRFDEIQKIMKSKKWKAKDHHIEGTRSP